MLFGYIPGLDEIKNSLIQAVKNNHIAHAQLIAGKEGSGSLAIAIALATYISCENRQENDSCGKCASCSKYLKLIHPDFHFIFPVSTTKQVPKDPMSSLFMKDWRKFILENPYGNIYDWGNMIGAENKQLQISVEEARSIVKTISMKAFESAFKILIVWLPENMNLAAANSILKILEEPPLNTIYLMVSNQPDKIIATILSRTQRITIRPFYDAEVKNYLKEKHGLDEKKAHSLAYLADGNLNEAVNLINENEESIHELFREWMRHCYKKKNFEELVKTSEEFHKKGREEQKNLLVYGLHMMRECLIFPHAKNLTRLQGSELEFVEKLSKITNAPKIEKISKFLSDACYHIERNGNSKIIFLDTSFQIASALKIS